MIERFRALSGQGRIRRVRTLQIIGIGMGDPEQLTLQAISALNKVDVFFVLDKGEAAHELTVLREGICARHIPGGYRIVQVADADRDRGSAEYTGAVLDWHEERAIRVERAITDELPDGGCGGFLVWGDPAFYDSTIRVVDRIRQRGGVDVEYDVIPGISSLQVLAAAHRIVLNGIGEPVLVTTGRRLAAAAASGAENILVMLDGNLACRSLAAAGPSWEIYWGAALGSPDQALVAGPLADVIDEIASLRTGLKQRKGWVMDTYLLRRPGSVV